MKLFESFTLKFFYVSNHEICVTRSGSLHTWNECVQPRFPYEMSRQLPLDIHCYQVFLTQMPRGTVLLYYFHTTNIIIYKFGNTLRQPGYIIMYITTKLLLTFTLI